MRVFVSWSGDRSQMLAQALREWLPLVLHYVQPWLSEKDIGAGKRWSPEIATQLEESNFGIVCITPENIESSWILFEAGALAKSLQNSYVVPLLLNVDYRDVSGPLSQFQAKKVSKLSMLEIVQTINQAASDPVEQSRLLQLFEALWPQLEERIIKIPVHSKESRPARSQHDILEELVSTIRGIDQRLQTLEQWLSRVTRIAIKPDITPTIEILPLDAETEKEAKEQFHHGNFIPAIKIVKAATNLGLIDAKNLVESWKNSPDPPEKTRN